jgi:hypothetical protein
MSIALRKAITASTRRLGYAPAPNKRSMQPRPAGRAAQAGRLRRPAQPGRDERAKGATRAGRPLPASLDHDDTPVSEISNTSSAFAGIKVPDPDDP